MSLFQFGRVGSAIARILAVATSGHRGVNIRVAPVVRAPERATTGLRPHQSGRGVGKTRAGDHAAAKRHLALIRALSADKTRAPGERAHRRWRKRRAAGRG